MALPQISHTGLCFIILVYLFPISGSGQVTIDLIGSDNLPSPENIAFVSKSTGGFYYFGNTTGLTVFDGNIAEQITIRDPNSPYVHDQMVQSKMYEDNNGLLWFSTYTALHSYNPNSKFFRTYRIERDGNMVQQNYHVFYIDQSNNELWLKAGHQLWSFNTKNHHYRRIAGPTLGNRFVVSEQQGGKKQILACPFFYGKGIEVFMPQPGTVAEPRLVNIQDKIISAIEVNENEFLLGMVTGLAELRLTDTSFQLTRVTRPNKDHSVWDFCRSEDSNIVWLSRTGLGIYAYDPLKRTLVDSITPKEGLSSNNPKELYADGPNRIIASQYDKGVDIIETSTVSIHTHPSLADQGISSFMMTPQRFLLAAGLQTLYQSRFKSSARKWEALQLPPSLRRPPYRGRFFSANNRIFLQGLRSIWHYDSVEAKWNSYPKQEYPVRGMFISPDNTFLMLSERGMEIYDIKDDELVSEPSSLFSPNQTNDFLGIFQLSDSTFLLPWRGSEVWICAYNANEYYLRQRIPLPGEIQATLQDNESGIIYVGGTSGLFQINNNKAEKIILADKNAESPIIEAIVKDSEGILWVGTRNGLFSYNCTNSTSTWFSSADGLPSDRFIDYPALLLPSDSLLMGTRAGFFTFSPHQLKPDTVKLTPYVSGLRVNDIFVLQDTSLQFSDTLLRLPYRKNKIDFQVANIGLHQNGISAVEYQLIGLEENPTLIEAHQTIRYPNLPPGNYTLQLTAINRNGLPSGKKSLAITIRPPFTQTLLFYILCTCALALLSVSLYLLGLRRERLKQERLQEQQARLAAERDRIAGEVHDDLGGQISSILYLSEGMLLTGETPEYEYELNRINELSRSSLQNVRDIIFALDNRRASLFALGEQLSGAGEAFFGDHKISFRHSEEYSQPNFVLTSRQKRNLTLIVKEAWHNIAKHAKATVVNLDIKEADQELVLTVTDNGVGFVSRTSDSGMGGYGLDNMQEKATAIGGQLAIDSTPGQGTALRLTWPLPITDKKPKKS